MVIRKLSDKKYNIVIFNGSPRKENSCADLESKSEKICNYILDKWETFIDFEYIDLGVGEVNIQPCKGCVSSSNGFHCHFPCSCYKKNSKKKPDLMYDSDIYEKLQKCDAFLVVSPIHWYSVTTQVKAMFDRLVCINQTITVDKAIEIFGDGNIKDSKLTGKAELSGKYDKFLKNHYEGKYASFYIHGDDGATDYNGKKPKTGDDKWDIKSSVMPLVYQCRYSGMECPDDLVEAFYINKNKEYYQANLDFDDTKEFFEKADKLIENILKYLSGS